MPAGQADAKHATDIRPSRILVLLVVVGAVAACAFAIGMAAGRSRHDLYMIELADPAAKALNQVFRERERTDAAFRGVSARASCASPGVVSIGGVVRSKEEMLRVVDAAHSRLGYDFPSCGLRSFIRIGSDQDLESAQKAISGD